MWKVLNRVSKLSELGLGFYIKKGARTVNAHLFNCIDVMAVLPTGFGKRLIFEMFVMMCGVRNKIKREQDSRVVISPFQSTIRDQVVEVNSMGMTARDLNENLDCLDDIHQGKFSIISHAR